MSFALHLDKHLGALIAQHGTSTYAILFAIVFAETGLVGQTEIGACFLGFCIFQGSWLVSCSVKCTPTLLHAKVLQLILIRNTVLTLSQP